MSLAVQRSIKQEMQNDADLRAFAQQVDGDIILAGWVNTSDTGQANLTTITKSGSANTSSGYKVYRMDDALHGAGKSVYLKLEFGTGNTATSCGLWLTVGTGTDGAGTINGIAMARTQCGANGSNAATANIIVSGDTNRLGMFFFNNGGSNARMFAFCIERTHDGDGADNNEGIMVSSFRFGGFASSNSADKYFYIPYSGSVITAVKSGILTPSLPSSGNYGSDVGVYPNLLEDRGRLLNPSFLLMGYFTADIVIDSQVSVTHYGAAHTFWTMGVLAASVSRDSISTTVFMMRYE